MVQVAIRMLMGDIRKMMGIADTPQEVFTITTSRPFKSIHVETHTDREKAISRYEYKKRTRPGCEVTLSIVLATKNC